MSAKSNPTTAAARERQLAHEQEHNDRKYDRHGRRRPETLPPKHPKGARLLPRRTPDWLHGH